MSDGFLTLYVSAVRGTWITDWVTGTGARLTAPGTDGLVAVLDLEGDRHLVDRDQLSGLLADNADRTFQTWFSGSDDMIVTVRRHRYGDDGSRGFVGVTCYLDGLDPDDVDAVSRAAQEVIETSTADALGLVVDRRGTTADVDWDSFVASPGVVPAVPDLLILASPQAASAATHEGRWRPDTPVVGFSTWENTAAG